MASNRVYSVDSSALIHAWNRAYRPKNFPTFWRLMHELIDDGGLKCSMEVLEELKKKDDDLYAWAKSRKDKLFMELDEATQNALIGIMERHPKLVDTAKGKSGGDPFVIALAMSTNPRMTVVTQEDLGKVKIPDVCDHEGIEYFKIADLIEAEDWIL